MMAAGKDRKELFYSFYVLLLLLLAYLLNQLDRYTLAIVTKHMAQDIHYGDQGCISTVNKTVEDNAHVNCTDVKQQYCDNTTVTYKNETLHSCKWDYTGNGLQYQLLAGPVFIVFYTFSGIFLGYAADRTNRKNLLAGCIILWSATTVVTGFSKEYWHLVILRLILGAAEAGCTPFAASIITDYFAEDMRGFAIGIYNWGIYMGYSMSYAVGNFITDALGWQWAFYIAGMPGILLGIIIFLTLKEPERKKNKSEVQEHGLIQQTTSEKLVSMWKPFLKPALIMICIAGSIRNGAGYVWGYNTQLFFNTYYPDINTGNWFSWIPLVGGSLGVAFGGFISDRFVKRRGPSARVLILIASLLIAAPFAIGTLYLKPPLAFISQIPCYIFGEMWVGVTLAVVVELVPSSNRASAVAVYLFIISNIGGNMPLLVPPLKDATNFRFALLLLYPGCYVAGALLFLASLPLVMREVKKATTGEKTPLLSSEDLTEE
ncbi:protein spinster homolog 1-like [Antedon mediterranea]|uniref:protein spinster homolog 1-like n=1 Tax=Antedon mediterranea TaxID=105859 RepID=UPI003AF4486B